MSETNWPDSIAATPDNWGNNRNFITWEEAESLARDLTGIDEYQANECHDLSLERVLPDGERRSTPPL